MKLYLIFTIVINMCIIKIYYISISNNTIVNDVKINLKKNL